MSLPHSAEAEQSLVARLLLEPEQIGPVAEELGSEEMYVPAYREAYRRMVALVDVGKPVDVVVLGDEGWDAPVDILSLTAGHHAPLSSYVEIIKAKAYQREMIERGKALVDAAYEGNVNEIVETAAKTAEFAARAPGESSLGIVDLAQHRSAPAAPLLGALSPEGTTVLYGDGGDGKGWVAAKWASQLDARVAILDFENHPNEWAYRLDKFGLTDDVLYVSPGITLEKWANERAARLLREERVGFLIVDSAMYASNVDDPYSPASAMAYKFARLRLGNMPAILLAHTTGGQDKVFGSVFWRNEARIVWRLGKSVTRQRYLECRKANNYQYLEGKKYQIEFSEERGILNLHDHGKAWVEASRPEPETELDW
jgi:DnaB helicase-like protein